MKIFDVHIHSVPENVSSADLLGKMNGVGISGGAVFSPDPESPLGIGYPYDVRMQTLEKFAEGCSDKIFPVLWIHPYEKDAIAKAKDAVERGVRGFKMACDSYYVYEDKPMELLSVIAKLDKPVLFHSGILWNGYDSSKYNRPVHWESLVGIGGLRFSLAHCAWPWCDETIAMYGKFLNAYTSNPSVSAEMFLDLTPGTPHIYRKELIYKLYNCGYDTPRNMLFGTDCTANNYNFTWAKDWIDRDSAIMREIGVSERIIEHYFYDNYMRFFGETPKNFTHVSPVPDCADAFNLAYANETIK